MANNGVPYQKYDGASGTYQQVGGNNDGSSHGPAPKRFKWILGMGLIALLGVVYGVHVARNRPKDVVKKAIEKSDTLHIKANGQLKLFDEHSKYRHVPKVQHK